MQDEMQKLTMAMMDMKGDVDEKFNRLMDIMAGNRDQGDSNVLRNSPRPERHHQQNPIHQREEQVNPFATAPLAPNHRHVKLKFPRFAGGDPTEWVSKVKQYFDYQGMPLEQQVSFSSYHLDGVANEWWQAISKALREDQIPITWMVFEEELWARFGPTDGEDFHEALSRVCQTGTLSDYQQEFERLQNKVRGWSQQALVGTFMGGLNTSIADGIRMFRPKTLKEVINYARLMDGQLQRQRRGAAQTKPQTRNFPPRNFPPRDTSDQTPKKLSWEELKRKRSLGLCFSCDERYTPGHRCKQPQLFLMEGEHESDDESGDEETVEEQKPEITMYALAGWDSTRTLRIHASIQKHKLVALIDSGSTHNFISDKVARELKLPPTATSPFTVRVANGSPLICSRKFDGVCITMGGETFTIRTNLGGLGFSNGYAMAGESRPNSL